MADEEYLRQLIANPHETLSVELKAWFDPDTPQGQAKIIRSALSLRNYGGGFLLIGFDNLTGNAVSTGQPDDVRVTFHIDKVQGLITRFASESFEVFVHIVTRDGQEYPVIEIPTGVRTPVATKSSLTDPGGRPLVRDNRVYVRSLDANNTPSSSEARWKDWRKIAEVCFENREADIGRFLRRHLAGLSPETIREIAMAFEQASRPQETTEERARRFLNTCIVRFRTLTAQRSVALPEHGAWETGVLLLGDVQPHTANRSFLSLLLSSNPDYTGWPVWVDSRNFSDRESRPYVYNDAWEALIISLGQHNSGSVDFWRIHPGGEFYQYRALEDDVIDSERRPAPTTELDLGLHIIRMAEAIAVGLGFAQALCTSPEQASAAFAFRWSGLRNRELSSWANPLRGVYPGQRSHQDEVFSLVEIPVDTPLSSLSQFVHSATAPLFEAFDGHETPLAVVEDLTRRLIERRL